MIVLISILFLTSTLCQCLYVWVYKTHTHTHPFSIRFLIGRTCVPPVQDFLNLAATHYLMCELLLLACKLSLVSFAVMEFLLC